MQNRLTPRHIGICLLITAIILVSTAPANAIPIPSTPNDPIPTNALNTHEYPKTHNAPTPNAQRPTPLPSPLLHWSPLYEPGSGGWMTGMRISPHDSRRMLVSGDMLGVGLSTDGGKSWQATTGFKTWEMGDLTWHPKEPNTVWAGSVSGPYVSYDGGKTWQERREGMPAPLGLGHSAPIERVLFDPNDVQHLLAIGGSSRRWDMIKWEQAALGVIWESRDAGQHWTRLVTLTAEGASNAADAKGINIVSATFAAGSSRRIYAALDAHGVRVSDDGGKTWEARNTGLPHPDM